MEIEIWIHTPTCYLIHFFSKKVIPNLSLNIPIHQVALKNLFYELTIKNICRIKKKSEQYIINHWLLLITLSLPV